MCSTEFKFRVECEDHFWSFMTLREAKRFAREFQQYVKNDITIVPIESEDNTLQNQTEEISLTD